jgi:DNA invertase Pin-like site-specific DNA recombinase
MNKVRTLVAADLVAAETNLIRKMLDQNLGCSHEEIMQKLNISRPTYHRHINRIYKQDAKIWDKIHSFGLCKSRQYLKLCVCLIESII